MDEVIAHDHRPWRIYASHSPPRSGRGDLLSWLLFMQVCLQDGFSNEDIARCPHGDDAQAQRVRASVRAAAELLAIPLREGRLSTFARRFGGGPLLPIPAEHWEVDDPLPRFATASYAFDTPFDPAAEPTHWIFADHEAEAAILDLHREWEGMHGSNPVPSESPDEAHPHTRIDQRTTVDGFIRLPQLEHMIGLKKSTIYERIGEGRFPRPEPIGGGRAVGWRVSAIQEWLET